MSDVGRGHREDALREQQRLIIDAPITMVPSAAHRTIHGEYPRSDDGDRDRGARRPGAAASRAPADAADPAKAKCWCASPPRASNRPDVMQRQGRYPPPPGRLGHPGLEIAGEVVAFGAEGLGLQRSATRSPHCCRAEAMPNMRVAAAPLCLPIPKGLSMVEAAAIPETFFTVWTNLFERGRSAAGETVLIHGGTSGIGTTAIQLADAWGARVFATAGSADKARACERLGAVRGIDYRTEDFVEVIREQTAGKGVGPDPRHDWRQLLRPESRDGGGRRPPGGHLIDRRRACRDQPAHHHEQAAHVDRFDAAHTQRRPKGSSPRGYSRTSGRCSPGAVRPIIHATFPLAEAGEAHRLMETSQHIGKIVLEAHRTDRVRLGPAHRAMMRPACYRPPRTDPRRGLARRCRSCPRTAPSAVPASS